MCQDVDLYVYMNSYIKRNSLFGFLFNTISIFLGFSMQSYRCSKIVAVLFNTYMGL